MRYSQKTTETNLNLEVSNEVVSPKKSNERVQQIKKLQE
jgi:hypothetical protein